MRRLEGSDHDSPMHATFAHPSTFPSRFGKYTLLGRLGVGGMAEVLLAQQEVMGAPRLVAVKRLHQSLSEDPEARQMFLDEMRIVAGMRHPNIGHVMEVGEIEGTLYLAMEHIEGRDLGRVLKQAARRGERLPLEIAVEIGRQVCAALDHAHTRKAPDGRPLGIVHRDVTPENVILTFDGNVKVVDFGIARADDRVSKTRTGLLKGTPAYMAPEQIRGQPVDGRADVFALGALLYQITTGTHPFGEASGAGVLLRVLDVEPEPPGERDADFPDDLERAILGALEKDPDARWPDAAAFSETLDATAARHGRLVSSGRIARWICALFPEAAKARSDLAADPSRMDAAQVANYMGRTEDESGPALPDATALAAHLEAWEEDATFQVPAEMIWGQEESADPAPPAAEPAYAPATLDMPATPDPLGAAAMEDAAGDPSAEDAPPQTSATRPGRVFRPADPPPSDPSPPAPASDAPEDRAAESDFGPADAAPAPWSLADHWAHLPPAWRRPAVVAMSGALLTVAGGLMGIGLLTVLGWLR